MAICNSCKAQIRWLITTRGLKMPVDVQPSLFGNLQIDEGIVSVLSDQEATIARRNGVNLYVSHFATCPNAEEHRSKAQR